MREEQFNDLQGKIADISRDLSETRDHVSEIVDTIEDLRRLLMSIDRKLG